MTESASAIASAVRGFIRDRVVVSDDAGEIADDTPLLGSVLDSLALLELVAFLEEEFGILVEDEDVTADNFRTVADIERLVSRKTG